MLQITLIKAAAFLGYSPVYLRRICSQFDAPRTDFMPLEAKARPPRQITYHRVHTCQLVRVRIFIASEMHVLQSDLMV